MLSHTVKKLIWAAVFLALCGSGALATFTIRNSDEKAALETVLVARSTLQEVVTAQGKLEPKDYVDVGAQVSGQLKKLHVEIGSIVKKGDLLAELDPLPYESRVTADEAKLNSLKAQVAQKKAQEELDRSQVKRAETLIKVKAISQDEMETRATALKVTVATVESLAAQAAEAEANLESDRINLGYTKIYAPMDGIVADQIAREGQTLNANQTTPKIVQLADLEVMTVRAQVAEADVMRLKTGMEASFAPLGALERTWKGIVRQILPTPEIVNDVVLYDALIDVTNTDRQLMNGMSAQVFFEVAHADNVLTLPVRALGKRIPERDDKTGKAYTVKARKNGNTEERTVHVGLMTRTEAEIRSGLAEDETVIIDLSTDTGSSRNGKKNNSGPRPPVGARL
jgi:membrane fusion protein, macrolide-specific efflux system